MLDIFESLIFFVCISQSSFELEKTSWMYKISLDFCTVLNHSSLTVLMLEIDWEASLNKAAWLCMTSLLDSNPKWNELICTFATWAHALCCSEPYAEPFVRFQFQKRYPLFIHCSYLPLFCLFMVLFKKEPFCLIFLCIHKCAWHIQEEGTSFKELPPWDWPVGMSVGHFLM